MRRPEQKADQENEWRYLMCAKMSFWIDNTFFVSEPINLCPILAESNLFLFNNETCLIY